MLIQSIVEGYEIIISVTYNLDLFCSLEYRPKETRLREYSNILFTWESKNNKHNLEIHSEINSNVIKKMENQLPSMENGYYLW